MATLAAPGLPEIERARERLDGVARVTPAFPSETLSRLAGRPVSLKAENLQRTGSFKIRGAYVKLSSLDADRRAAGVVAASAGNHGLAIAFHGLILFYLFAGLKASLELGKLRAQKSSPF